MTEPLPLLADLIALFLEDRIAKGVSPHTLRGYRFCCSRVGKYNDQSRIQKGYVAAAWAHYVKSASPPESGGDRSGSMG